jgi:PAB1-binding protein PBP1
MAVYTDLQMQGDVFCITIKVFPVIVFHSEIHHRPGKHNYILCNVFMSPTHTTNTTPPSGSSAQLESPEKVMAQFPGQSMGILMYVLKEKIPDLKKKY